MKRAKLQPSMAGRNAARHSSMPPAESDSQLTCAAGLFETIEPEIMRLTTAIGQASTLREKAGFAGQMVTAASELLGCPQYDTANLNCVLCRKLSTLRHETAALVLKLAGANAGGVQ